MRQSGWGPRLRQSSEKRKHTDEIRRPSLQEPRMPWPGEDTGGEWCKLPHGDRRQATSKEGPVPEMQLSEPTESATSDKDRTKSCTNGGQCVRCDKCRVPHSHEGRPWRGQSRTKQAGVVGRVALAPERSVSSERGDPNWFHLDGIQRRASRPVIQLPTGLVTPIYRSPKEYDIFSGGSW